MPSTREIAERILAELRELENGGDPELEHSQADALLCEMLVILGYDEIVQAWHKIDKWYAGQPNTRDNEGHYDPHHN